MKDIFDLLARVLLSIIFLFDAYDSIFYFDKTKAKMTEYGLTWNQDFLLYTGIFVLLLGGILLLLGYRTRLGVSLLLIYLIPVTFIVHAFWKVPFECMAEVECFQIEQIYRRVQSILFMKNLAIVGGLLMVWINGSGRWSVKRLFATTKVRNL